MEAPGVGAYPRQRAVARASARSPQIVISFHRSMLPNEAEEMLRQAQHDDLLLSTLGINEAGPVNENSLAPLSLNGIVADIANIRL